MKHLSLLVVAVLMGLTTMAQTPSKFNYQAVARDADGLVVSNGTVGVKITILSGSASGTEVYSETHSAATNVYGLLNFQIGAGSTVTGDLSTIDWGSDAHFIKVEMDPAGGSSYTVSNTSELISVPYAEYALSAMHVDDADADSTNELQSIMLTGDSLVLSMDGGNVDLSGYDQSAGVAANDSAIGVNADDIAANAADIATNASDLADHIVADMDIDSTNELITDMMLDGDTMLQVTEDGVTHEVDLSNLIDDMDWVRSGDSLYNMTDSMIGMGTNSPNGYYKLSIAPKGTQGGLYVNREYSSSSEFGIWNRDYYHSGFTYGIYNYLYDGSSGAYGLYNNIYYMNSTEYGVYNNMYYGTGTSYGVRNYIYKTSGGGYGVYNYISNNNSTSGLYGNYNQIYGGGTTYGTYNYGRSYNSSSSYNAYGAYNYGYLSGSYYGTAYGSYNTAYAGKSYYDYAYGSYNYASGGYYNNYAVYSSGYSYATGYWYTSDRKLKKNIRNYEGAMSDIMQLKPKVYDFDTETYPLMGLPETEQLGLIAQELEEVFPTLVNQTHEPQKEMPESAAKAQGLEYEIVTPEEKNEEGEVVREAMVLAGQEVDFKAVNYSGLIPVLIKGIQEQQEIIEANEATIEDLKARIEALENN